MRLTGGGLQRQPSAARRLQPLQALFVTWQHWWAQLVLTSSAPHLFSLQAAPRIHFCRSLSL